MTTENPRCLLAIGDPRVDAVRTILGIGTIDAIKAFTSTSRGRPSMGNRAMSNLRARITLGIREYRRGGLKISYMDIAGLVGAPNHSTVMERCETARRLGLLSEGEIAKLNRGGAIE